MSNSEYLSDNNNPLLAININEQSVFSFPLSLDKLGNNNLFEDSFIEPIATSFEEINFFDENNLSKNIQKQKLDSLENTLLSDSFFGLQNSTNLSQINPVNEDYLTGENNSLAVNSFTAISSIDTVFSVTASAKSHY